MNPSAHRPRRLRQNAAIRRLVQETTVRPSDLILPMFVKEGLYEPHPLTSMPGVVQHTLDSLVDAAQQAVKAGVGGIMLFGIPTHRDARGTAAYDPNGILNLALRRIRAEIGEDTVIMADLCLDEFTDHGHCGILAADGTVDNDATVELYARMALSQAEAGAHILGLSGMMDNQVAVVRAALEETGYTEVGITAYTAKYASAFYGPFREAVESTLVGDRKTYQQDPANAVEARKEAELDIVQGADTLIVKPGLPYLDILSDISRMSTVPVWAYQISGEYAMIEAAAQAGAIDRWPAIMETLLSFKRAGAGAILTYWATEVAAYLQEAV